MVDGVEEPGAVGFDELSAGAFGEVTAELFELVTQEFRNNRSPIRKKTTADTRNTVLPRRFRKVTSSCVGCSCSETGLPLLERAGRGAKG
jgi:hypothetical protein